MAVGQVSRTEKKAQIAHHHFLIAQILHCISTCTDTNCEYSDYSPKQTNNKVKHLKFVKQLSTVLILCLFWKFDAVYCGNLLFDSLLLMFYVQNYCFYSFSFIWPSHSMTHCLEGHFSLKPDSETEIV